jgi:hypothetical protein
MPLISAHQSGRSTKLLLIGDSGAGKTGALFSLAKAGYNLRLVDFDNGADVLASLAADDPKAAERIIYETFTDKFKSVNGKVIPDGIPTAFSRAMNMMTHWKTSGEGSYDLGKISDWGPQDILVIDSLTHMSLAAFRLVLGMNGRLGQQPQMQDWGIAQDQIESTLALLYSTAVKCNVIVISHVSYIGGDEDNQIPVRGLPTALGKALSPKIGSYFNTILLCKSTGQGNAAKKQIITRTEGLVGLKHSAPGRLLTAYPQESGLATIFDVLRRGQSAPKVEETAAGVDPKTLPPGSIAA